MSPISRTTISDRIKPMAGGFAKDGAVQDQIDASIQDAVDRARKQLPRGESLRRCEECDVEIPPARREAVPGVRLCINARRRSTRTLPSAPTTGAAQKTASFASVIT